MDSKSKISIGREKKNIGLHDLNHKFSLYQLKMQKFCEIDS